jgi:pyruvate dehydrogenase E1 component beta subunit
MPKLSYLKALNRALGDEMERDPNIFLLGEDVKLGLTNATAGLYSRFGDSRVLETPLSEQGFTNFHRRRARRPARWWSSSSFLLMLVFRQIANQANKFSIASVVRPSTGYLPPAQRRLAASVGCSTEQPYPMFVVPASRSSTTLPTPPDCSVQPSATTTRWWFAPIAALRSARSSTTPS